MGEQKASRVNSTQASADSSDGQSESDAQPSLPTPVEQADVPVETHNSGACTTVVAIDASAGGLDAITRFLDVFDQSTGMAPVFIQHVDPNHESMLPELLGSHTSLAVTDAADGMAIEPDHIYVIPPNAQMELADGKLKLMPWPKDWTQYTPIDHFFVSLAAAEQLENKPIDVLQGTAGAMSSRYRPTFSR